MSTILAPSFRAWAAQTFGIPKGALSAQNEVSEAEAVESFATWFCAVMSAWDGELLSETDKRKSSDTDDFRQQARARVEFLDYKLKERKVIQDHHRGEAPYLDRICEFLDCAVIDAHDTNCNGSAEYYRDWVERVMRDWADDASSFKRLTEKGQPMADGVVKGMEEIRGLEDYMQDRETKSAKDDEREPIVYNGFPENRTHLQQVIACLDGELM